MNASQTVNSADTEIGTKKTEDKPHSTHCIMGTC